MLLNFSSGSSECEICLSLVNLVIITTELLFSLYLSVLYLFVVMMEVVGKMQASGGVGAGSVLSFPLAFVVQGE